MINSDFYYDYIKAFLCNSHHKLMTFDSYNSYYILIGESDDFNLYEFKHMLDSLIFLKSKFNEAIKNTNEYDVLQNDLGQIEKYLAMINNNKLDKAVPRVRDSIKSCKILSEGYGFDFIVDSMEDVIQRLDEFIDVAMEDNYYRHKGEVDWNPELLSDPDDLDWMSLDDDYEWLENLSFDIKNYNEIMSRFLEITEMLAVEKILPSSFNSD